MIPTKLTPSEFTDVCYVRLTEVVSKLNITKSNLYFARTDEYKTMIAELAKAVELINQVSQDMQTISDFTDKLKIKIEEKLP